MANKSKDNRGKQPLKEFLVEENIKSKANNEYPVISSTKDDVFLQSEYFNKQVASSNNIGYKVLKRDRIVLSPQNAWMGNINLNYKFDIGIVSPSYKIFRIVNANTNFFKYLIKTPNFIDRIDKFSEQGASVVRKNLNLEELLDSKVYLPTIQEQEKIGGFLSSFDKLILKQQEKIGLLKELKKGYLQQMFPVKGSNIPKIRFNRFSDAWEQCNWKEKVDILTNMVNPINGEYNNLPHIGPGNIESFTGKLLDNVRTVGEDGLISGKFQFERNDIIYGKINPQLGKYVYAPYKGLCSADSYVLRGKNGLKQTFLYTLLQTDYFFKYSVSVSMRSGMPKINRSELSEFNFMAPTTTEQDKIGTFILSIEKLITLHQRKLEGLEEMKKGYMQRLFL